MKAIRVGNVMFVKDKVISITLNGRGIRVATTIGETSLTYESKEDAQKVFDSFYEQLNQE